MNDIVKDSLVIMDFPIPGGEAANKGDIIKSIIDRKEDVEKIFFNNEYLKLDLTHQQLLGLKSTSSVGVVTITDLPALNYVLSKDERYKNAKIINIGNVDIFYNHFIIKDDV